MKTKLLLIIILISFTLEFRSNSFIRKLNEDSIEIDNTEPETEIETEPESYLIPRHPNDTVSDTVPPDIISSNQGDITIEDTSKDPIIPKHPHSSISDDTTNINITFKTSNFEDSVSEEKTTKEDSNMMPNVTDTTISTVISDPDYQSNLDTSYWTLILVEIGYFTGPSFIMNNPMEVLYTFIVYYLKINFFFPLPLHMRMTLTITYTNRYRVLFRALQEVGKKNIEAECTRFTYDYDNNARYNCSFPFDVNQTILNVTADGNATFIVSDGKFEPTIIATPYVNKTMFKEGIQNRKDDGILENKKIYILNNTILEENGLKFKLTGESLIPIGDNNAILSFDEKGNGEIKNATCNIYKIEGNIYELDCTAKTNINAYLNGVNGITSNTDEKIIIIMKPDSDNILNVNSGNNYLSLYGRKSSSGLSAGAIAGIVISCIIVLLAIAIGGMLCRRIKVPATFQESTLGINVSKNNSEND